MPEGTEDVAVNTPIARDRRRGRERRRRREGRAAAPAPAPATPPAAGDARGKADARAGRRRAGAAERRAPAGAEPEWTGATVNLTVREALRDAMAEEMRRDGDVFLMGEEVAEYQGAYKVSQGLLQEFGAAPRHRHADHRAWLRRPRRRRRLRRACGRSSSS